MYAYIIDFGDSLYKNFNGRLNIVALTTQLFHYKSQSKL